MPFPLGHTAIGLVTYDVTAKKAAFSDWRLIAAIVFLANLPDVDVIFGLLLKFNGCAYHRGPTHSLIFALVMGIGIAQLCKRWSGLPQLGVFQCILLILSHVISDAWLTSSPVSFFWPFEVYWSGGNSGWTDVVASVVTDSVQDIGIALACISLFAINRLWRAHWHPLRLFARYRNWPAAFFG